jgi:CDP-diacylglycerol pyrophosphatase
MRRVLLDRSLFVAVAILAACISAPTVRAADPDALWKLVHDRCVPDEQQHGDPAPCAVVVLGSGPISHYVVLKDIRGATQYLVIPTAKVTGIEDPAILDPASPNYFAAAWNQRSYTEAAAGPNLPHDAISLAINSPLARSQNQLHIHIDCLRADVRAALEQQRDAVGDDWAPLAHPLVGHHYWAMRVIAPSLDGADPFKLLASKRPGARETMGQQTLAVVGTVFAGDKPGFILLNDSADLTAGDRAGSEELQDHTCDLTHSGHS